MLLYKLLSILFFIKKAYNYVILPFHTEPYQSDIEDTYFDSLQANQIYTNLKIGTPTQTIKVFIEYRQFNFFISKFQSKRFFNDSNSQSYKKNKVYSPYLSSILYLRCALSNDKFSLNIDNKNKDRNLNFLLATDFKEDYLILNEEPPTGIIGLIFFDSSLDKDKNLHFIDVLKEGNAISNYIWSIKYNDNGNDGEFLIGANPHEIYPKNYKENIIKWTKTEISKTLLDWEIIFDEIYYGNYMKEEEIKKFDFKSNSMYTLDENVRNAKFIIENGMIKGSYEYNNYLKKNFFKNNKCKEEIDGISRYYICDLNTEIKDLPSIYFINKELNYTFSLNYNDLFVKNNNQYYFLVYFFDSKQQENYWTIGKPFLKKYQLIFDHEKRRIGIYNGIYKAPFPMIIILIIVILITFALSIVAYYIYRRRFRRKRINELEEIFDYNPRLIT